MKGTEKQINWAGEIAERVIKVWDAYKTEMVSRDPNAEEFCNKRIDAIRNAEYASDIIGLFKDYRPNGDMQHDVMALAAIYRVTPGDTTGQKAILCK